jgi:hypothetical protein
MKSRMFSLKKKTGLQVTASAPPPTNAIIIATPYIFAGRPWAQQNSSHVLKNGPSREFLTQRLRLCIFFQHVLPVTALKLWQVKKIRVHYQLMVTIELMGGMHTPFFIVCTWTHSRERIFPPFWHIVRSTCLLWSVDQRFNV